MGLQNQPSNTSDFAKSQPLVEPEHSYPSPPLSESSLSSDLGCPAPNSILAEENVLTNEAIQENSHHQAVEINESSKDSPDNFIKGD